MKSLSILPRALSLLVEAFSDEYWEKVATVAEAAIVLAKGDVTALTDNITIMTATMLNEDLVFVAPRLSKHPNAFAVDVSTLDETTWAEVNRMMAQYAMQADVLDQVNQMAAPVLVMDILIAV